MIPKFRAWDIENKKMYDCYGFDVLNERIYRCNLADTEFRAGHLETIYAVEDDLDNFELMQSTELPDKEGNEIWHKDILDESYTNPMTGELVVVRYIVEKENGIWRLKDFKGRQQYDRYLFMRNGQCTRIGNIYENPELLEVE